MGKRSIWTVTNAHAGTQRQRQRKPGTTRRLALERLETRSLLTAAVLVDESFRQDNFTIDGNFTYRLHEPDEFDYIDTINNGRFVATAGQVTWTSPTKATGSLNGRATGDGRDTVDFAGRRTCSEYGIEETGGLDFNIDAALSKFSVQRTNYGSSRYTYYRDMTGGYCPQPDPPWARVFGGFSRNFSGAYSPQTHLISLAYVDDSPETNVNLASTPVVWSNTAGNALTVQATGDGGEVHAPDGWIELYQTTTRVDNGTIAVPHGNLVATAQLTGKPIKTATPSASLGSFRLFWATSAQDFAGAEVPISTANPPGLHWNTDELQVRLEDLPAPPANATHVRVTLDGVNPANQSPLTGSAFLPLERFQPQNSSGPSVAADQFLQQYESSVLHPADRANPLVKVLAYRGESAKGATVEIDDDRGGYSYNPVDSLQFRSLGVGQSTTDEIHFLAVYNQGAVAEAVHTVTVQGVNDYPEPEFDQLATTNYRDLQIAPTTLLQNDVDVDAGDRLRVVSVSELSEYGATITPVWSADQTEIVSLAYHPASSASLRALPQGQHVTDLFFYEVSDRFGATGSGAVQVEVTGDAKRIFLSPIAPQAILAGDELRVGVTIDDPDGDASDVTLTATAVDPALIDSTAMRFEGAGGYRELVIPTRGTFGQTWVELTAQDSTGATARLTFGVATGTADDLDLDGRTNDEEDQGPNGGDANGDGVLDRLQPHVASLATTSGAPFSILAQDQALLTALDRFTPPPPADAAANATFLTELLALGLELPDGQAEARVTIWFGTDAQVANRVFRYPGNPAGAGEGGGDAAEGEGEGAAAWLSWMASGSNGARIFGDRIEITLADGGDSDLDGQADGHVAAQFGLATVSHPWQNTFREDVNNDGTVAPIDALLLINQILSRGPRALGPVPTGTDSLPMFLDPSGSDSIEAQDVLIVINYLNQQAAAEGEGGAQSESSRLGHDPAYGAAGEGAGGRDGVPVERAAVRLARANAALVQQELSTRHGAAAILGEPSRLLERAAKATGAVKTAIDDGSDPIQAGQALRWAWSSLPTAGDEPTSRDVARQAAAEQAAAEGDFDDVLDASVGEWQPDSYFALLAE